jgi:hypothetical protein
VRGLVAVCCLLTGLIACLWAMWKQLMVRRSARWPSTLGEIVRSEVVRKRGGAGGSGHSYYEARIEYRYRVGGRSWTGTTIDLGGTVHTSLLGHAEKRCAAYPAGVRTLIYYDPERPQCACLERTGSGPLFLGAVGVVFAVTGLFLM